MCHYASQLLRAPTYRAPISPMRTFLELIYVSPVLVMRSCHGLISGVQIFWEYRA